VLSISKGECHCRGAGANLQCRSGGAEVLLQSRYRGDCAGAGSAAEVQGAEQVQSEVVLSRCAE